MTFKTKPRFKLIFALSAIISLIPSYANALSCASPPVSHMVQSTIKNPETAAIVRGILKVPKQKYVYENGIKDRISRPSYGTIDGYIASVAGFYQPVLIDVELNEDC